jgi:hypothetical protein
MFYRSFIAFLSLWLYHPFALPSLPASQNSVVLQADLQNPLSNSIQNLPLSLGVIVFLLILNYKSGYVSAALQMPLSKVIS